MKRRMKALWAAAFFAVVLVTAGMAMQKTVYAATESNADAGGSRREREDRSDRDGAVTNSRPTPMVYVSRSEIKEPLAGGKEQTITLYFKNLGDTVLKSPVAQLTPSESLYLSGASASFPMPDIRPKHTGSITFTLKALQNTGNGMQSLGAELKFNYDNGSAMTQASVTDKIPIPTVAAEAIPQPAILISGSAGKNISAGQTANIVVNFLNAGKGTITSPYVTVNVSDALSIVSGTSTFLLNDLQPGENGNISLTVKAANEITTVQSLEATVKYSYHNGTAVTQAETTGKIGLPANMTNSAAKPDASVPIIMIRSYEYGGAPVSAGGSFNLKLTLKNMGKIKIENLVGSIDGGENFTVNGSNSFLYSEMASGEEQIREIPMQAVFSAKTGIQPLVILFKYEYTDEKKRTAASQEVKLSVPVFQEDRFSVNRPAEPGNIYVGEETTISLPFVNKGKSEVSNVEATIEGNAEITAKTQYLGNFESGKSGNIGFAFTPRENGEVKLLIRVQYEDAARNVRKKEFPVTLTAVEKPMEFSAEPEETKNNGIVPKVIAAAAAAVLLLLLIIRRRKKAKALNKETENDWTDGENAE